MFQNITYKIKLMILLIKANNIYHLTLDHILFGVAEELWWRRCKGYSADCDFIHEGEQYSLWNLRYYSIPSTRKAVVVEV